MFSRLECFRSDDVSRERGDTYDDGTYAHRVHTTVQGIQEGITGVHRPSFQPGGGILVQRGVGVGFLAASQLISRPIFLRIHVIL